MSAWQKRWLLPLATLALMAGILCGRVCSAWVPAAAGAVLFAFATALAPRRVRLAATLAAVMCLGCALGQRAYHPTLPETGTHEVCGVVADEIREGSRGGQRKTILRSVTVDDEPFPYGAYWTFYTDALPEGLVPGATVRVTARTYEPSGADNPGGFDFHEYVLQKGVALGVYGKTDLTVSGERFSLAGFAASLRVRLAEGLTAVMGEEAGDYAATMLLGVRGRVSDDDRAAFSALGIAHILSVSGYHVGVLMMALMLLMQLLRVPRQARLPILAAVLGGYALLTGLHAPVVRATLLAVLAEYGLLHRRQRVSVHLLCATAFVTLLFNPAQLTSVSFQLSYGAMAGLTLVTPWLTGCLRCRTRLGGRLWRAVCAGIGAQVGLLLPEMYWFQSLPIFGVVMNIAVFALAQVLLGAYWLTLLVMAVPGLGPVAGRASAALTDILLTLVRACGDKAWLTMWTCRPGLLGAAGCVLLVAAMSFLWWPKGRRRAAAIAVALVMTVLGAMPWPHHGADYIQLSVGSADAAVLHDEDMVCVIDTGEDGEALAAYLRQRRMAVDSLFLTHLHTDHAGGVQALLADHIPVRRCYLPAGVYDGDVTPEMIALLDRLEQTGTEMILLSAGDTVPLPDGEIAVLWPEPGVVPEGSSANRYSLALRVEVRGTTMLLMGDLDKTYEMRAACEADLLKAAHHGSKDSTTAAFLEAVHPAAILLSCGDEARQTSLTERAGDIPVYGTREKGAVRVVFDADGWTVQTMR